MMPVVAIVGRPNVGKSTVFNRICGERLAIVDDYYGVTRDRMYQKAEWLNKEFRVIDTGGIEIKDTTFQKQIKAQVEIAIDEADLVVFVVDITTSLHEDDLLVAKMLYKSGKKVIVALNKCDNNELKNNVYDFYELGFDSYIPISSIHGIGFGDLLDEIVSSLPDKSKEEYDSDTIKLAIIGEPNVGKSSLTNAILNEERSIVSEVAGTTTDSIDTPFVRDGKNYVVIDTAGMRKKGKIFENLEKYSVLRALQAIERSNICLLVIDAIEGIRENDKHIAGFALEAGKPIILVVNKWDAIIKDNYTMKKWEDDMRKEFKFLSYAPIAYVSALNKKRIDTLFPLIEKAFEASRLRVNTSLLNDCIVDAMLLTPPAEFNFVKLKVYYVTQVSIEPPTFVLFVNDTNAMHFSYERYLENKLRETFDLFGTPIKIILRKRE